MVTPPDHLQSLLPSPRLRLRSIDVQSERVAACASTESVSAECPLCSQVSKRLHSTYERVLQDLPWQGRVVELRIQVRRFRCQNKQCRRKTFVEQVPAVATKRARQTERFSEIVRVVGYALGGEAGCRLAKRIGMCVSADMVLRRVTQSAIRTVGEPRRIGVDDWAWRKGQRYGTIVVDLEAGCPIDLLPDRSSGTLADWLKQHPSVELISRDRAEAYADGARKGAPQAIQVADRFHLVCNLTAAVERVLERKRSVLALANQTDDPEPPPVVVEPPVAIPTRAVTRSQAARQRRLERYDQIVALHRQGMSQQGISKKLHMGRKTIRRFLRADQFPERAKPRRRPPQASEFRDYLERRWKEGCHNASILWREIKDQGYAGCRNGVAKLVTDWRTTPAPSSNRSSITKAKPRPRPLSPRQVAMLLTRRSEKLTDAEQTLLQRISKHCPESTILGTLAQSFSSVLRNKDVAALQPWLESAAATELPDIKTFCDGLLRDVEAVKAAISMRWSNGPVEGHVHRLKLIKRQMYGRANFNLLRARVLPLSPPSSASAQRAP
jgi:transposase